jgi:hypothetical protein
MKLLLPRITGTWCKEFDCRPEHHPGCDRHTRQGCDGCEYAEKTIIIDCSSEDEIELGEREQ